MEVQLKSRTFNNCDACNWVWSFSLAFMPQFLHCGYIRQVKSEDEEGGGKGSRGCTACVSRQSISHWHIDWMLQRTEPWSPDAMPALAQLTGWLDDSVDRTKERTEVVWQQFKAFSKRNIDRACAQFREGAGGVACKILAWWHVAHVAAVKEFLLWIFQAACYERAQHIHNAGGNV